MSIPSSSRELKELVSKMNNGNVSAIIHFDSNPVYELAPAYDYKNALKNVETVISLSETPNETASVSQYVLPINNFLNLGVIIKLEMDTYHFSNL